MAEADENASASRSRSRRKLALIVSGLAICSTSALMLTQAGGSVAPPTMLQAVPPSSAPYAAPQSHSVPSRHAARAMPHAGSHAAGGHAAGGHAAGGHAGGHHGHANHTKAAGHVKAKAAGIHVRRSMLQSETA